MGPATCERALAQLALARAPIFHWSPPPASGPGPGPGWRAPTARTRTRGGRRGQSSTGRQLAAANSNTNRHHHCNNLRPILVGPIHGPDFIHGVGWAAGRVASGEWRPATSNRQRATGGPIRRQLIGNEKPLHWLTKVGQTTTSRMGAPFGPMRPICRKALRARGRTACVCEWRRFT